MKMIEATHQSFQPFESLHWVVYSIGLYELCVLICKQKLTFQSKAVRKIQSILHLVVVVICGH